MELVGLTPFSLLIKCYPNTLEKIIKLNKSNHNHSHVRHTAFEFKICFLLFYIRYFVTLNAIVDLLETFLNLYYDHFLDLKI